jgi:BASS family bile acid:Na+ symporter
MKSLRNYLGFFIFGGILLGLLFPAPMLPFKNYLMYPLMLLVFLSALKINVKDLRHAEHDFWRYFILAVIIFIIPSLSAFLLAKTFLPNIIFIGLMIVAAAPTAIGVVFLSDIMKGDAGKALIGTTFAHLLSPLLTPFAVWFLAHEIIHVPFVDMLVLIGKLIFIPVILAQIVRWIGWDKKILSFAGWLNEFLLFLLIWGTIAPAQKSVFANPKLFFIALGIFFVVLTIQAFAGYFFGRDKKEKITWIIIGISKDFTLSSVLALTLFGAEALVAPAAFVILSNAILIPLEWWVGKKK